MDTGTQQRFDTIFSSFKKIISILDLKKMDGLYLIQNRVSRISPSTAQTLMPMRFSFLVPACPGWEKAHFEAMFCAGITFRLIWEGYFFNRCGIISDFDIKPDEVFRKVRQKTCVKARSLFRYWVAHELKISLYI